MMTEQERKDSRKASLRKYRISEKNYENQLRYRKKNMELFADAARRYYHKDVDKSRERNRINYISTREERLSSHRKYADNNRIKRLAKDAVNNAIRSGKLVKELCWCGSSKVQGHHEDYNKPLEVIWLCIKHHKELHMKYGPKGE